MNKSYLIAPTVLALAFALFYRSANRQMVADEEALLARTAAAKSVEDLRRAELDRKAEGDARQRQEERDRVEREREAKRIGDYEAAMHRLREETATYSTEAAKFGAELDEIGRELASVRRLKEETSREVFELMRQVELPRIARRTAEMEIQRAHEFVTSRLSAGITASLPVATPAVVR